MRNLPWKKIAIGAVGVAVFAVAIFYFTTGKGAKTSSFVNPAFGEYISSYTAGVVPSGSYLRIVLAQEAADSSVIGQESSEKLFDFSPSVKGRTIWLDARTVEFRPEKRLTAGQVYEVDFMLSRLIENIPADLKTFEYTFQVIPLNFEISIDNVKTYMKTDLKRQKIEGALQTSDFAENESVEKMLTAQQDGKALKITWTHAGEGKQHTFIVEEVERKEAASKVTLTADGKVLGVEQRDEREIEIPARGDFKITNVKVEQSSTQHIVIQFSDPLSEKQNLAGLISVSEVGTLDFEIRDNEIRVFPPVRQTGSKTMTIDPGIRNVLDYRLKEGGTYDVVFEQLNPAVRFTGKGTVLPSSDGLILPFEAVNLKTVDVQIIKIYESNILQFLQVNQLDGSGELRRVGKPVLNKAISLDNSGVTDLGKWNRFTLDLSTMINTEPGAIYQVRIGFKRSYITFACEGGEETASSNDQQAFETGES
jgi:alpha-2-macroglobulin